MRTRLVVFAGLLFAALVFLSVPEDAPVERTSAGWTGWVIKDTPVVERTTRLPFTTPQDPAIVRGPDQWYLFYNQGPYAWQGWTVLTADSLDPLTDGQQPFEQGVHGRDGLQIGSPLQSPNDWLYHNGSFYAIDSSFFTASHIWRSRDLRSYEKIATVDIPGSDPGFVHHDGQWHVFTESGTNRQTGTEIMHSQSPAVDGPWNTTGVVLDLPAHTGDPDLLRHGSTWYMFVDYGPHNNYSIGYATTTVADFPHNWTFHGVILGPGTPHHSGTDFGTGDADVAIEENTLYLFFERPVGVAHTNIDTLPHH